MRSAPIRLTKFESGVILDYLEKDIRDCQGLIEINGVDKNSMEFRITALYDLREKMQRAYDKCEYKKAYARNNTCDDGDM